MDFRDRLLSTDIRHLTETLRALSEEFIVIQGFVQHQFGRQLKAYLKTRNKSGRASFSPPAKRGRPPKGKATSDLLKGVQKMKKLSAIENDISDYDDENSHDDGMDSDSDEFEQLEHDMDDEGDFSETKYDGRPKSQAILNPTISPDVQVKFEPAEYEDHNNEAGDGAGEFGFDPTHFLALEGADRSNPNAAGASGETPQPPKRPKRGGRTKDKAWLEFVKVGDRWECCYCEYTIKYAQLDRIKKHLDACRHGVIKKRKPRRTASQKRLEEINNSLDRQQNFLSDNPAGGSGSQSRSFSDKPDNSYSPSGGGGPGSSISQSYTSLVKPENDFSPFPVAVEHPSPSITIHDLQFQNMGVTHPECERNPNTFT